MDITSVPIASLNLDPSNVHRHGERNLSAIKASLARFGQQKPIVVTPQGVVIAGNGTLAAAKELGWETIKVIRTDLSGSELTAYGIADNRTSELAEWDMDGLRELVRSLEAEDAELALATGFASGELDAAIAQAEQALEEASSAAADPAAVDAPSLADRFGVPPFSVLNAREGSWQGRKRQWLAQGLASEEGRGAEGDEKDTGGLLMRSWTSHPAFYKQKAAKEKELGITLSTSEFLERHWEAPDDAYACGTSIFDPVLTEIAYRWFSPKDGLVLDPFAGGSVRGIVAAKLGRQYLGVDLRPEQVQANERQAQALGVTPRWIAGDSRDICTLAGNVEADFVFSCPPYADLECYSDDPRDLSTMDYPAFLAAYRTIIKESCALLKEDAFACFVVGEVRDRKTGNYRDFVGDTVQAFKDAGLHFYNEIILVTAVGSLPIRAGKQFTVSRKVGKTHQNVLVFVKGDAKLAAQRCGEVEMPEPAQAVPAAAYGEVLQ